MSRYTLLTEQEDLEIAYGLDHATGPYVQIWATPADEQDAALVVIDNLGLRYGEDGREALARRVSERTLSVIDSLYQRWTPLNCTMAPSDINAILESCGLHGHLAQLYKILD